ncbi:MAG: hypothetical protein LBP75_07450, partial [Planctomycetota bacterium]|nr:hypothetical protein [Planctomycetota bacterium]
GGQQKNITPCKGSGNFCVALTGRVIYGRHFTQRVALGCYALPLRGDCRNFIKSNAAATRNS